MFYSPFLCAVYAASCVLNNNNNDVINQRCGIDLIIDMYLQWLQQQQKHCCLLATSLHGCMLIRCAAERQKERARGP